MHSCYYKLEKLFWFTIKKFKINWHCCCPFTLAGDSSMIANNEIGPWLIQCDKTSLNQHTLPTASNANTTATTASNCNILKFPSPFRTCPNSLRKWLLPSWVLISSSASPCFEFHCTRRSLLLANLRTLFGIACPCVHKGHDQIGRASCPLC